MSLDVVNAHGGHGVAGPATLAKGLDLSAAIAQAHTPTQKHESLPPGSQESQKSATSKHTDVLSSVDMAQDRQLTPTSSQSGFGSSSPQQPPPYLTSPNVAGGLPSYEPLPAYGSNDDVPNSPVSVGRSTLYHVDATAGRKRTASGMVKTQRAGSAESGTGIDTGRPRTTSAASRTSQVGELTSQLRARLTYAKVKVQNGWESRTLDEIEHLASLPSSPAASVQTHGSRNLQSPYSRANRERTRATPTDRTGFVGDRPLTAPSRQLNYGQPPGAHVEPPRIMHPAPALQHPPSRGSGSLAPPLDFSHPRRTPTRANGNPSLETEGSHSTLSASTSSSRAFETSNLPAFYDREGTLKPTPQSSMEQDAIETLLFMRSPNNSANFGRHASSQSSAAQTANGLANNAPSLPGSGGGVRPTFPPPRQVPAPATDRTPISPRKRALEESVLAEANLHDSQGIDSALDEMRRRALLNGDSADTSDDEEEGEA